jgi:hypothetical protein
MGEVLVEFEEPVYAPDGTAYYARACVGKAAIAPVTGRLD